MGSYYCYLAYALSMFLTLEGTMFVRGGKTYEALFVFGDSYADTGNRDKYDSRTNAIKEATNQPWRKPYGMTWPGKPSGRFSDGRVFTDFYASHLHVPTPVPYKILNSTINNPGRSSKHLWAAGINFAYGGTGLFSRLDPTYPTVGQQIQELKNLINRNLVSKKLIASSVCLLTVAGNDYSLFLSSNNPSSSSIREFIPKVIDQMGEEVEALYEMGFASIAVTTLEPVGCLPVVTAGNNYRWCNETLNFAISIPHNLQLVLRMGRLQLEHIASATKLLLIDFYTAFLVARGLDLPHLPLKPCCQGINGAICGTVNENGDNQYKLCRSPRNSFFWDLTHPTDLGWERISNVALAFV